MNLRRSILVMAVVVVVLWGYILFGWVFGTNDGATATDGADPGEPSCRMELVETEQGLKRVEVCD